MAMWIIFSVLMLLLGIGYPSFMSLVWLFSLMRGQHQSYLDYMRSI